MLLHRVEVENFRSLREGKLDLVGPDGRPVQVMTLVGPNGSGKTAWLDAIAGFFTALVPAYGGPSFDEEDVYQGAPAAEVRVAWTEGDRKHAGTLGILPERASWAGMEGAPGVWGDAQFERERQGWAAEVAGPSRLPSGVIVSLDTHRFAPSVHVSGPNASRIVAHRTDGALRPSLSRPLFPSTRAERFGLLHQWIVNVEFLRARAKADRNESLPLWEHLVSALNRLLAPCRFERVDEDFAVLFRTPTAVVPIERLSSGYAAGDDTRNWDPFGGYWPPSAPRSRSLDAVFEAFGTLGYARCTSGDLVEGQEKVAVYVKVYGNDSPAEVTHAARQLANGRWASKLGSQVDVEHDLADLYGSEYGHYAHVLTRPRPRVAPTP